MQLYMGHRRTSQEPAAVLADITLPRTSFDRNRILAPDPSRVAAAASVILSDRCYIISSSTPVPTHSVTGGSGVEAEPMHEKNIGLVNAMQGNGHAKIVHQQFSLIKPTCPFKINAEQNGE